MGFAKNILLEKNHPGIQFFKYSMCGGTAMAVDMVAFFLVAWLLFPALTETDVLVRLFSMEVEPVPEHVRTLNFCIGNGMAFMLSNLTAYILNVLFVFRAGKHSRWKEVGLFYLVSAISVGIGVGVGVVLIQGFGLSTTFSYVAKAVSTTLINYAARKYIIFHG
ncbi:MAG: GtrA family protein [Verrucomicrobiota bacterium]